jgi:hypothetical protein
MMIKQDATRFNPKLSVVANVRLPKRETRHAALKDEQRLIPPEKLQLLIRHVFFSIREK